MKFIKTVIETGKDDRFFVELEGFKKQLSSLSVTEVDAFDVYIVEQPTFFYLAR